MSEKILKPQIRFKGFTDAWEQRKVSELFRVTRGYVLAATQTETTKTDEKPYPVYSSQTKDKGLMGYYKDYLYEDAITWTTDGANAGTVNYRAGKFYCTNVCGVLLSNEVKANQMIAEALDSVAKGYVSYVGNPKLMNNVMADIVIQIPTQAEEREQLSSFFAKLDNLITLHQRKYEKLQTLKKALLEKMFPANNDDIPQIRFKGFTDAWEQRKLDDMCSIITKQTGFDYSATIKPSLLNEKNDKSYSFIQNKDFSGMNINLDTDFYIPIDVAKKFSKIMIDTPSLLISISGKIGNVGFYDKNKVSFIGGAVGICKLTNPKNGELYVYELESEYGQKYFQSLIKASSHANITVEDIRNINVIQPKDNDEILKISKFLKNVDSLIALHQRKCEKLKNMKKALLDKMFC